MQKKTPEDKQEANTRKKVKKQEEEEIEMKLVRLAFASDTSPLSQSTHPDLIERSFTSDQVKLYGEQISLFHVSYVTPQIMIRVDYERWIKIPEVERWFRRKVPLSFQEEFIKKYDKKKCIIPGSLLKLLWKKKSVSLPLFSFVIEI